MMMQQQTPYNLASSSRRFRPQAEEARIRIASMIQSQPGIRYRELARETRLAHGTLSHNIEILERQRRIRVRRDRGSTRFFPESYDSRSCDVIACTTDPTTMAVMFSLWGNINGCNYQQIKRAVMKSSSTVCEHLKRLCLAGVVSRRRNADGIWIYGIADIDMAAMIVNARRK